MILLTRRGNNKEFNVPRMFGKPLELVQEVKCLGVTLEAKMRPHIEKVSEKAIITMWQLRRLIVRTWGFNLKVFCCFYIVVRSRFQYGSWV